MRVLLACDIDTDGEGNPYTLQLLHALGTHSGVNAVQHGTCWKEVPAASFDVVHLQWPEALVYFKKNVSASELGHVRDTIVRWAAESIIVTTVHNEHPHNSDSELYKHLYHLVYNHSDGIIHLGDVSKEIVRRRYKRELKNAQESVIPHGNYTWFPNSVNQREARNHLNIDINSHVVLAFGAIRSGSETKVLLKGFRDINVRRKRLWIVGRRTKYSKSRLNFYKQESHLHLDPRICSEECFVPSNEIQMYLNAADVLFIPRVKALNSGNVALGFTFGRVVVGPDCGVIGETLKSRDNPVYDPKDRDSWGAAMEKGLQESLGGRLGRENQHFAEKELSWDKVGHQHVDFYRRLLEMRERSLESDS